MVLAFAPLPEVCRKRYACFGKAAILMPVYAERARFFYEIHRLEISNQMEKLSVCSNFELITDTYVKNVTQLLRKASELDNLVSEGWEEHSGIWGIFFALPSDTFEPVCVFWHNLEVYYLPQRERHILELYEFMNWAYATCVSKPPVKEEECEPGEIGIYTESMLERGGNSLKSKVEDTSL